MLNMIPKDQFVRKVPALAIRIPVLNCQKYMKLYKDLLLNVPKKANIVNCDEKDYKILLLKPNSPLPAELSHFDITDYEVTLEYNDLSAEEIFKELIPPEVVTPSGFETVGHIAHFNLTPSQMPYKHIIGAVTVDVLFTQKNPAIKTAITKLEKLNNLYRNYELEIIGGEPNLTPKLVLFTQKEQNCVFEFNLQDVYWSSKLEKERTRVLAGITANDVICDIFAGVGPFALRAAKQHATVVANDLNPACYHWISHNTALNKLANKVSLYNMDAREFIKEFYRVPREECKTDTYKSPPFASLPLNCTHIYMNLPGDAIEFLDVFSSLLDPGVHTLPMLHIYGFSTRERAQDEFTQRITSVWPNFSPSAMKILEIRDVAASLQVFCIEMTLPGEVAYCLKRAPPSP